MRNKPLRRKTGISRAPLTTGRRKPSETLRVYGPPARRAWVKSLPCIWCGSVGYSENAHVITGGTGRKADSTEIVPLCGAASGALRSCHAAYDQHRAPFDDPSQRAWVKAQAAKIEALWQAHAKPEHISTIVKRVMEEL